MAEPIHHQTNRTNGLLLLLILGLVVGILMALLTGGGSNVLQIVGIQPGQAPGSLQLDIVAVGKPAPDFRTTLPDGTPVALSDYRGTIVALNFWATWCGPCRVEMPALQVASESFPDGQFIVLAVNAGEAPNKVTAFMAEEGLTFPALMDRDGKIVSLYGVNVFPTTVWVDAEGIVQAQHFGPLTSQQIDDYVTTLIDGS